MKRKEAPVCQLTCPQSCGWEGLGRGEETGNRKSDRDESDHGRGGQRADDAHTVTNPDFSGGKCQPHLGAHLPT